MGGVAIRTRRERPIPARRVRRLYDHVGWWPDRRDEQLAAMLEAGPAVGAWAGDRLVGFARAVTDGRFRAFVEDVAVHEQYRRRGVAGEVLARLLDELSPLETVSLFCDPALAPLYAAHGFRQTKQVVMHRPRRDT